jgi:Cu2+-exporting ATPase
MIEATMGASLELDGFIDRASPGLGRMDLAVDGIKCAGCMARIERAFEAEPGIVKARVNLSLRRLHVEWEEGRYDPARIGRTLTSLGFTGHPFTANAPETEEKREEKRLLRCLGVAAFASMNIMLLSVSVWSGNATDIDPATRDFFHWLSGLIALPTAAYSGRPFFKSAMRALRHRSVNMDVPISLGILLALGMSVVETLHHAEHAYFDSAVMLIFFLLIGRYAEQAMRRRTRDFAANLAALRVETAHLLGPDGRVTEVPIAAVKPGDLALARPGDRVAIDGRIETGRSEVDQSMVTGETAYAEVGPGDMVHAGSLNVSGALTIRVTAAEKGTLMDDVRTMLSNAMDVRASYVRLADRAARLYAPMVHVTALAAFLGWLMAGLHWSPALVIAITVLIITCPCALGLAVPAVQVVAAGSLFRRGVLLNGGEALERFSEADTVVFDKTGTLTLPEPRLVNAEEVPAETLRLAGRLALASRHPLALAVAGAAGSRDPLPDARETPGHGVEAEHEGRRIRLGSPAFCGAEAEAAVIAARHPIASLIALRDGENAHVFAIAHSLRPDALEVVRDLAAMGYAIEMLSGDRESAVADVARRLGIATFRYGQTPQDKIARLDELKRAGRRVMMVGDGLNDAAALAAAHVSISPVTAAQISQAAADAVFMGERLAPVVDALAVSRKAKRLMLQNLWFSVLYNLVAVPIAIAGLATPLVAALAMSGSSVVVTANAMRARLSARRADPQAAQPGGSS